MKKTDIIIGHIYFIKGSNGRCTGDEKCNACKWYPEHKIRVTGIENGSGRCIEGENINSDNHCYFDPRDLVPLSWKERFK